MILCNLPALQIGQDYRIKGINRMVGGWVPGVRLDVGELVGKSLLLILIWGFKGW